MRILRKQAGRLILLIGDVAVLATSLYLALSVRYLELPGSELLATHFRAFIWLFAAWVGVFFIAGLYDRDILLFPQSLPSRIFRVQIINSLLGVVFFYTIPHFAIAPKTNLFVFVVVSFGLILLWRNLGIQAVTRWLRPSQIPQMVLVASGRSAKQAEGKLTAGEHNGVQLASRIDPDGHTPESLHQAITEAVKSGVSLIVVDTGDSRVREVLPHVYDLLYRSVRFYSFDAVYEQLFDRVALRQIEHRWFVEQINLSPHVAYDFLKRVMDVLISVVLLVLFVPFLPLIALAIQLEDGGPIFYSQNRIGAGGKTIRITKLRTMTSDQTDVITTVGWFLRRTRIDEFPQLWDILRGDLSLIGPRPELPDLVDQYQKEISYYNARHLIKPGISGWAQLRHDTPPKYGIDISKTKQKLAYDLYYIKHRSLLLDIKIALQTLQVIMSQSGE